MSESETITANLVEKAQAGHLHALGELLQSRRDQLERIVEFRMDFRLRGRIDAADVVQEAFVEATQRFPDYVDNQPSSRRAFLVRQLQGLRTS